MSAQTDYWTECLSEAADECSATLTHEQLACLAKAAEMGHECYGMAFYSPPNNERIAEIEREWQTKFKKLQAEYDTYQRNAETAVKQALNQHNDAQITIGEFGEVSRYDGRVSRIQ